jgi:ZIP family zinc transporter
MVAASFEFIGSSHRNDHEGFAKVMPAAFGFPCLIYFGIDKVLPHLHINFKISEGIKSPTNHLVGFTILHNIPKDWLLEFFWWSRSWDSRSFYCWAVTLL